MKETYKVSTPKQIKFGDPWYYEQYSGKELERLVVDLKPPAHFESRERLCCCALLFWKFKF